MAENEGTDFKVMHTVDWLNMTYWNDQGMLDVIPPLDGCKVQRSARPLHGYDTAEKLFCGGLRMWCQNRPSMGIHYQFTGENLRVLREECGGNEVLMLRSLYHPQMKKVSRIDIAVDVFGKGSVDEIIATTNQGGLRSRLSPSTIHLDWQAEKNGKTAYFGSPKSEFRVRVYDKAHQLKALWDAWTRIEAQVRDDTATGLYRGIVESGTMGTAVKTVHKRIDFPTLDWFGEAMECEGEIVEIPKKPTDFDKWLRKQVIPACSSKLFDGENMEALHELYLLLADYFSD